MPKNIIYALCGIVALLVASTVIIGLKQLSNAQQNHQELWLRLRSWWIMVGLLVIALFLGRTYTLLLLCVMSLLALNEFLSMTSLNQLDKRLRYMILLAAPLQFWFIWQSWHTTFVVFIPVFMFLLVPFYLLFKGETEGFLKTVSILLFSLICTVFALSHAAFLLTLPASFCNPNAGNLGLLLFVLFLTQFNDVLQYVWGKLFGHKKVTPRISPSKTWVGLMGGATSTILLAWLIAPYLTALSHWQSLIAGAIIGMGGFMGDIMMSAIKRDMGIKNTSALIPGHGGMLDRVDSLTVTAPLFYFWVIFG